jgi:hypothetical protein
MRPSLGVLITYFNERELLTECLEGLLGQPDPPDEVLVYDDASEVPASEYVPPGAAVKVIRGSVNVGPARGRNLLLDASASEYVHFHDADDLFQPEWCARVREAIAGGVDVVLTEVSSWADGALVCERGLGLHRLAAHDDLVAFALDGSILPAAGTYRRSRVLEIGGYRESLWQSEDFDFHVRLAAAGVTFALVDEPQVRLRLRSGSRSQDRRAVWTDCAAAVGMLAEELDPRYRPLLADTARRAGVALLELGAFREAHAALRLAGSLGPATLRGEGVLRRGLARTMGVEGAEWLAWAYRRTVPGRLRRWARRGAASWPLRRTRG